MRRLLRLLVIVAALLGSQLGALATPGELMLASTSDEGTKGDEASAGPALSADGRSVAFYSNASNLDPGDMDAILDIYVKDLGTRDLTLASTSDEGVKGNATSHSPALSSDGKKVAFWSEATNLDPADTDAWSDVYVKDIGTGDVLLASTSDGDVKGNQPSATPDISADGTEVAFQSRATNLDVGDPDYVWDVYVKDLVTGDLMLVSTSTTGVKGNGDSDYPKLSADGTKVVFYSQASNLDPADTDTLSDVYVKDLVTGDLTLVSTSDSGEKANKYSYSTGISADGKKVAFYSYASNLDYRDTDTLPDVYLKDLTTGDLTLVSTSELGEKGNWYSFSSGVSPDGNVVAFWSYATNLHRADPDGLGDIYVKNLVTGELILASTSGANVKGNSDSFEPELAVVANAVAFTSRASNLDPMDGDVTYDVYVKRIAPALAPNSVKVTSGSRRTGGASNLGADDDSYFEVNSTERSTYLTGWQGIFKGVPRALKSLAVSYEGKSSAWCTQKIVIRDWVNRTWTRLDERQVGGSEIRIGDMTPRGTLSNYVNGTGPTGSVRVKITCRRANSPFFVSGDQLVVRYT